MKIININPQKFADAALQPVHEILSNGGIIAYPTETVYGFGANIYQKKAVEKIYFLKNRDTFKPLSIMITAAEDAAILGDEISVTGQTLIESFWPGPLTLILQASANVPEYLLNAGRTIGLRLPDHPVTRAIMKIHKQPITSTSVNFAGSAPLLSAGEIKNTFGDKIDMLINGGMSQGQIPSTVVDVSAEGLKILRVGAISVKQIENCIKERINE